jgi:hypothetical protein
MTKKFIAPLLLGSLIALGGTASAENPATPKAQAAQAKIDPAALAAAQKLFETMKMESLYNRMVDQATQGLVQRQPALASVEKDIRNFYGKYIGWNAIKDDMAKLYAKYFTPKELEDLAAFYQTPTGQKALRLMPQIMAEGRRIGMQKVMAHRDELKAIIVKAMQAQKPAQK